MEGWGKRILWYFPMITFDLRNSSSFEPGTFLIETPNNSKPWGLMQHNAFFG
jgi:hypothetical protein